MLQVQMLDSEVFTRLPFDPVGSCDTYERYHDDIYLVDFLNKFNGKNKDEHKRRFSQNVLSFSKLKPDSFKVRHTKSYFLFVAIQGKTVTICVCSIVCCFPQSCFFTTNALKVHDSL